MIVMFLWQLLECLNSFHYNIAQFKKIRLINYAI